MNREKKQLTPTEQKKRYGRLQLGFLLGEFVSVATPFIVIGAVNYNEYFVQYNGTKMSLALFMALAIMGLAIWLITKKKLTMGYTTLLVGWFTATLIFFLLGQIINDIAYIMLYGGIGILCANCCEIASTQFKKKKEKIIAAMEKANEEDLVDQYKEEKKVKIKIKK